MTDITGDLQVAPSDVQTIVDIARRDAERTPVPYGLTAASSIVVARVRDDENICVEDYEVLLDQPRQPRGHADLYDPSDFISYVNRLTNPVHTTVWADVDAGTVTAVLDDHKSADSAGWRTHTVKLTLRSDVDWLQWMKFDGKGLQQATFAEHIENVLHTIVDPDPATMLEVASTLQASKSAQFSQATRLDSGDIQLAYHEETNAKAGKTGNVEVPREFTILVTPWIGCNPVDVKARLKYNIDRGQLAIGYALLRPDLVKIDVFDGIVDRLRDQLTVKSVFAGTAPRALR
ncbi:YfdQ family protein [Kibdelosporangium phytohabitans]|uniref:DUF2303 family protein n=1 Tax=Kibdelosporangium phytohabitans TaxID=860235 RepID=A0A0N9HU10_9PSEU|nr:DUF2303 family protein [Kibdelosporangium phytohabitans]ALG06829.1 hypothetical protein AOZ06_07710 [Kibdelosporangium phytohabitans]MBE1468074.1 uncharacterized protein YfdQ (DUF2303 family) [Kibdelosporangium phytohabitans]